MRIATLLMTIATLALVGCANGVTGAPKTGDPPIGAKVRVQFKRSDLGAAAPKPVAPITTDSDVSILGKLLSIDREWIVVEDQNSTLDPGSKIWVPRGNVLMLQSWE